MRCQVSILQDETLRRQSSILIITYTDIVADSIAPPLIAAIKARGEYVIRGVFSVEQAPAWDKHISHFYLAIFNILYLGY